MFYQAAGQILLVLNAKTETRTPGTGGMETVFNQDTFMGLPMNPIAILILSILVSLKSCFTLLLKSIETEKVFVPFTSKIFILLWGLFASIRRIVSIFSFFLPSMGLFSILYHHRAEQLPFNIWKKYNLTQADKMHLYGLDETVLWGDIDRWDYSIDPSGSPPLFTEYTGLPLKHTFIVFITLTGAQLLVTYLVKMITSAKFLTKRNYLNKFLHLLISLNLASPFEDWDQGIFSVQEYRERHKKTNREMGWSLSVNIFFSSAMLLPLWYTGKTQSTESKRIDCNFFKGHQIRSRHLLLQKTIGTLEKENSAFYNINTCLFTLTSLVMFSSIMEILSYFQYNNKVNISCDIEYDQ